MRALILSLLGVMCLTAPATASGWTRELRGNLDGTPVKIIVDVFTFEAKLRYANGSTLQFQARPSREKLTFTHHRAGRALAFELDRRAKFVSGAILDTKLRRRVGWFREVLSRSLPKGAPELRGTFSERLAQVLARMARHRATIGERLLELNTSLERELDRLRVERRHDPRVLELSTAAASLYAARRRAMLDSLYDPSWRDPREVHGPNRPSLNQIVAHRDLITLLSQVRMVARPDQLAQVEAVRDAWRKQLRRELKLYRAGAEELPKLLAAHRPRRARKGRGGAKSAIARKDARRRAGARASEVRPQVAAILAPPPAPLTKPLSESAVDPVKNGPGGVTGSVFRLQAQRVPTRELVAPKR
jgi:hypothetical protein